MTGRPDITVALTSIPPRFAALPTRLDEILAQGADRVVLTLPDQYTRFPEWRGDLPVLSPAVVLLRGQEFGPASKFVAPRRTFPYSDLVICDDDCVYQPGWLDALKDARNLNPGAVIAASTFGTERLGLPKGHLIAQGFAGVLIPAGMLTKSKPLDENAQWVDDIWLSAQIAAEGKDILPCPDARLCVVPKSSVSSLQDAVILGKTRAELNQDVAHRLAGALGIWN